MKLDKIRQDINQIKMCKRFPQNGNHYSQAKNPALSLDFASSDTIKLNNIKPLLYEKLKNEDVLYDLYSGNKTSIPQEVLNNEQFMGDLYQDTDFMKASNSALKRAVADKLQNEQLTKEDKNELETMYEILSIQEELYNNPENSFTNGIETSNKNFIKNNKNVNTVQYNNFQPAFGHILNYGFIKKPKTRREKAEAIVNRCASAAAAESAVLLKYATVGAETAA